MTIIKASILAAFERMWQHITHALSGKADIDHIHDSYYTKDEVNELISQKTAVQINTWEDND